MLYAEKRSLQAVLQRPDDGAAPHLAEFVDVLGSGWATAAFALAALGAGVWGQRQRLTATAVLLAAAGPWCWLLTMLGQLVFAEQRPIEGGAMRLLQGHGHGISGHAAAAALLAVTLHGTMASDLGRRGRLAADVGLFGWALLVGWSRVYLGYHFAWNVVAGFSIGAFTANIATRAYRRRLPADVLGPHP
jgi:undecaprenyl-diphosphatase